MFVCASTRRATARAPETPAWSMRPVGDGLPMASVRLVDVAMASVRVDVMDILVILHRMKMTSNALVVVRGAAAGSRRTAQEVLDSRPRCLGSAHNRDTTE